ncbi:MAG: tetratricopeptide repeat protein [Pirellulales bacterium]
MAHPDVPAFRHDLLGFSISEQEIRDLLSQFPQDRELMAHLAIAIFDKGRIREEPTTMREGITKLMEANLPIYRNLVAGFYQDLAWRLMSQRKNSEAAVELRQSVEMFHELAREFPYIENYDFRARAYTSDLAKALGNSGQAEKAERLAENIAPRTGNDFMLRGNIFKEIKENDKAIVDFDRALKLGLQGQIPNIRHVGEFFDKRKLYEQAIRFYDHDIQVSTATPSVSRTYALRGASRANLKEYDKALADFDSSIEYNAWDCAHHLTRMSPIMLRESPEDFQQAFLKLADRAIEMTEGAAVSYVARAYVHQSLKRREMAVADLSKAIEIDSAYKVPWTLRRLLRELEANPASSPHAE